MSVEPLVYTIDEAAALLKISRTGVYRRIRNGDIRPVRIGSLWRVPRVELERYAGSRIEAAS